MKSACFSKAAQNLGSPHLNTFVQQLEHNDSFTRLLSPPICLSLSHLYILYSSNTFPSVIIKAKSRSDSSKVAIGTDWRAMIWTLFIY